MTRVTVIVYEGISIFIIMSRWNFYNFKIPDSVCRDFKILF